MKNIIKKMPLAISGTLLSVLSLGNLLNDKYVKIVTLIVGLIIILLLLFKLVFYENIFVKELSNPIVLSTSGTFSMALMVLSTYVRNFSMLFSYMIWVLGVLLHVLLILYYTYYHIIENFSIRKYYGSLWIVYIGLTMAAITGGILDIEIAWIFFVFGFIVMIPTILLVSYRYIKYPVDEDANKPLICIYSAIFNILTVGYYYTFNPVNNVFITLLYVIGFVLYLFSLYKVIEYIKLPFYPSFSAFTFPFVISATATIIMLHVYSCNILSVIGFFQTIVSIVLVVYVLKEYLVNVVF